MFIAIIATFAAHVFVAIYVTRRYYLKKIANMYSLNENNATFLEGFSKGYQEGRFEGIRAERIAALNRVETPETYDQVY